MFLLKKIKNIRPHVFISFFGTSLGVVCTVVLFSVWGYLNEHINIGKFSILFVIFFSTSLLCLLGNDHAIISKYHENYIIINKNFFLIFFSFFLNILIFHLIKKNIGILNITITYNEVLILQLSVLINNFNTLSQSFLVSSGRLYENSIISFFRYLGYCFYLLIWIFLHKINISYFFLIGEFFCLLSLFFYYFVNYIKRLIIFSFKRNKIEKKYFVVGLSQFCYQSLFKIDILVIAIIGNTKELIFYAIISNVIEGILNFITSFHPALNRFIVKKRENKLTKKDIVDFNFIIKLISLIIFFITPAYLLFHVIVFNEFPDKVYIISIIFLSISIYFSKRLFVFFHFYSMFKKPLSQLRFSFFLLLTNCILNIIFYNFIGIFGIALSTCISYLLFYFFLNLNLKNFNI